MKQALFSLFLFIAVFLSYGHAEESIRLAIGEYVPYCSEKMKSYGVVPRIVTAAFAMEGVEVKYDWYPWARAYDYARKGRWDGSVVGVRTFEREKDFYYSEPIRSSEVVFFHLRSYPFDWQSIDDITDIPIGGVIGLIYSKAFIKAEREGKIIVQRAPDDIMNFKKLIKGRIRLFPMSKEGGYFKLNENFKPEQVELVTSHPKPLSVIIFHLVLSRRNERNERMLRLFNKGLKRMKENGKYDHYFKKLQQSEHLTGKHR